MLVAPAAVLVALSLAIGIFAEPAIEMAQVAARQAIDRQGYIEAVAPQTAIHEGQEMVVEGQP